MDIDADPLCANDSMAIDLHTHTFNALYLPVGAIFAYWCRRGHWPSAIGFGVGRLLELIAIRKSAIGGTPLVEAELVRTQRSDDEVRDSIIAAASPEMSDDPAVRSGLNAILTASERRSLSAESFEPETVPEKLLRLLRAIERVVPEAIFGERETSRAL